MGFGVKFGVEFLGVGVVVVDLWGCVEAGEPRRTLGASKPREQRRRRLQHGGCACSSTGAERRRRRLFGVEWSLPGSLVTAHPTEGPVKRWRVKRRSVNWRLVVWRPVKVLVNALPT